MVFAVVATVMVLSSAAWACQTFRGRVYWEGNGGGTGDGSSGQLHYPGAFAGATWDLATDGGNGADYAGGVQHHHCDAATGDQLPGSGNDYSNRTNYYPGTSNTAPIVLVRAGNNNAQMAVQVAPSSICQASGSNKMNAADYELYEYSTSGEGLDGTINNPNACHTAPQGSRVSAFDFITVDSNGDSGVGVSNTFKAADSAGGYRMICLWDTDNGTSTAGAMNVKTV